MPILFENKQNYLYINNSIKYLYNYLPLNTAFILHLERVKSAHFSKQFSPINNYNLNDCAVNNQHLP